VISTRGPLPAPPQGEAAPRHRDSDPLDNLFMGPLPPSYAGFGSSAGHGHGHGPTARVHWGEVQAREASAVAVGGEPLPSPDGNRVSKRRRLSR
jgi:hypothetical protein